MYLACPADKRRRWRWLLLFKLAKDGQILAVDCLPDLKGC
jgi:hypothetical protein